MRKKIKNLIWWLKYASYMRGFRVMAMIGLTYFCQCRCPHCAVACYPRSKNQELTTEEIKRLISHFPPNKIKRVYFFGGEPLIRNDIFELIIFAKKKRLTTLLDTNGYLLDEKKAKKLKNAGLDIIGISIDSSDPVIHNNLRDAKNSFERAAEGMRNCLKEKIICYISAYATKENLKNGDLKKIISFGEKLGVNYIRILSPLPLGRWVGREDVLLNPEEEKKLTKLRRRGFVFLERDYCPMRDKKFFYISPYGDIQPCCYIPFSFGNIRKEPLNNILKRMWKHSMYQEKIKGCPVSNKEFLEKYFFGIDKTANLPINLYK